MRTTISIDEALLRRVRAQAAASGRTLSEFVEDALRVAIAGRGTVHSRIALPTFAGDGLMPGIDLDDRAMLLDRMDEPDADAPR